MSMMVPIGIVSGIGLCAGLVLAVASKVMAVPVDERYLLIRAELPGANCGACGYASCDSYAEALNQDPAVANNLCIPGGNGVAQAVSSVLGEEFEEVQKVVAYVGCQGNFDNCDNKMDYRGNKTCKDSKRYFGGSSSCNFGCIGLGDCARECPYGAIVVTNGLAKVDESLCVGCGICAKICPNKIISVLPETSKTFVSCSSKDKGAVARKACKVACIGCMKCQRVCPNGAVTVENNLATINQELCTSCGLCIEGCPTKAIINI